jgi:hypothetical protein
MVREVDHVTIGGADRKCEKAVYVKYAEFVGQKSRTVVVHLTGSASLLNLVVEIDEILQS